jgi:hypothetical protein
MKTDCSVYDRHCSTSLGRESGKGRNKDEGERRGLNPEAGFLFSLPMMHHNV